MAFAYDSSLIQRIRPRIAQWESTTGRRIAPTMLDSLIREQLDMESKRATSERAYDLQDKQLANTLDQQKKADRAAKVSGITGAVGTAANIGLTYKMLSKPSAMQELTAYQKSLNQPTTGAQTTMAGPNPPPVQADPAYANTPAGAYGADLNTPNYAPADPQGMYDPAVPASTDAGVGMGGASTYGPAAGIGAGLVAGAATNYAVTQTGEGKKSNAFVAKGSRNAGMTKWSDEEYASKGSATVGGLAGGGAWGAVVANVVWDAGQAIKTGKISNELLGLPFVDRVFNTNIKSIFGW